MQKICKVLLSWGLACSILASGITAWAAGATFDTLDQAAGPVQARQLLNMVNAEHKAVKKPVIHFEEYLHTDTKELFQGGSTENTDPFQPNTVMAPRQIQEDLDTLFGVLKGLYGPYYQFGGDIVFEHAKENILKEQIGTAEDLALSIQKHLGFIKDAHFRINGEALSHVQAARIFHGESFYKTPKGYQSADGRLVASVEGYPDLDTIFRRFLSESGDIVWVPVILEELPGDLKTKPVSLFVRYQDGSQQVLTAEPWDSWFDTSRPDIELHDTNGIPVLFVRNMGFDEARGDELGKAFLQYAEQLKKEPVIIIDLRSNGGGNMLLPLKWFQAYAGQLVPTNFSSLQYWSQEDLEAFCKETDSPYYISKETLENTGATSPVSSAYMSQLTQPDAFIPNPNRLLILLTGKNTASAAETFTDIARNLENTLIIGENTYGCMVSNAYTVITLPNSKIAVQLGSDLNIFPEGDFQEFIGFQPDLWADGDAEQAAAAFAARYLKESQKNMK